MSKSKHNEAQIIAALKQVEAGRTAEDVARECGGDRIAKGNISPQGTPNPPTVALCSPLKNSFSITQAYTNELNGSELENYTPGQSWHNMNVYADGRVVATYAGNYVSVPMVDWQGTRRAQLENTQSMSNLMEFISLPYGDGFTMVGGSTFDSLIQYTQQQYNQENNLYNFKARYLGDWVGRFMSPDWSESPSAVAFADKSTPQSLNLYGYVQNNPLSRFDATGHDQQVCGQVTYTTGAQGELQVNANCVDLPNPLPQPLQGIDSWINAQQQQRVNPPSDLHVTAGIVYPTGGLSTGGVEELTTTSRTALMKLLQKIAMSKPLVSNPKLVEIVEELFQVTDRVPGGTAGAVRYETATGNLLSDAGHAQEAGDLATNLERMLSSPNGPSLSIHDQQVVVDLINDLRGSLTWKP